MHTLVCKQGVRVQPNYRLKVDKIAFRLCFVNLAILDINYLSYNILALSYQGLPKILIFRGCFLNFAQYEDILIKLLSLCNYCWYLQV